ncbi:MAG: Fur family transcriptional regulator [Campylobacterota bacterium]|nr:Fur family transcriptional regulator [Campylobacterota bacterium]
MKQDFSEKIVEYNKFLESFKKILKQNSLKFTLQREAIIESLYNSDEHLTPELLHRVIQQKHPKLNIGIATIYRTLSLLEDAEMVTFLSFGAQGKKYEISAKEHHDHMICTSCGEITEFVDVEIESRQEKIAKEFNFKMVEHSMQIYGICSTCRSK